jgi:hypothetical protein
MPFPIAIASNSFQSMIQDRQLNIFSYLEVLHSRPGQRRPDGILDI